MVLRASISRRRPCARSSMAQALRGTLCCSRVKPAWARQACCAPPSPPARVWWGECDALQTPQVLRPLLDIAGQHRTRFGGALNGPRAALFEAGSTSYGSRPNHCWW